MKFLPVKGKEQRHLFEAMIYVIGGRGATTIWQSNGKKQAFEWQTGSLFAPPINCHCQHFNGSGSEAARMLAVTNARPTLESVSQRRFCIQQQLRFSDSFSGEEEYFSSKGQSYPGASGTPILSLTCIHGGAIVEGARRGR